jgi:hypothetical protein
MNIFLGTKLPKSTHVCCALSVSEQYAFRDLVLQQAKDGRKGIVEDDDDGSLERSNNSSSVMVRVLVKSYFQTNPKATLYCSQGINNPVFSSVEQLSFGSFRA